MEEEGTQHMDENLYNAARYRETVIPVGFTYENHFAYRTPGDRNNALHIAAQHGNPDFIEAALARVGTPEHHYSLLCQQNSKHETLMHLASEFGRKEVVEALLRAHYHAGAGVIPCLIERKSCWSEKDTKGDTPFHKALRNGHDDIAMLLLDKDIQLVSVCNESSESPAYLAMEGSCKRALERILGTDQGNLLHPIEFSGPFGPTVFHSAMRRAGHIMDRLIRMKGDLLKKDGKGKTILHYAVDENRHAAVMTLLRANSSLAYLQDNDGLTPLLVASSKGVFPMISTILELSPQSVEIRDNQ